MGKWLQEEGHLSTFEEEAQAEGEWLVVCIPLGGVFAFSLGAHLLQVLLERLLQGFEAALKMHQKNILPVAHLRHTETLLNAYLKVKQDFSFLLFGNLCLYLFP